MVNIQGKTTVRANYCKPSLAFHIQQHTSFPDYDQLYKVANRTLYYLDGL